MQKGLFKGYWLIVTIGMALLVPFFVLSFFTFPAADDLCVGSYVFEHGLFPAQKIIFQQVNSRIVSGFLVSVFVSNGLIVYRLAVFCILVFFFLSSVFFFHTLLGSFKKALLGGIAFILLTLNIFPDIAEMVYWISGAVNYFFPASLVFLFFAIFIKCIKNQKFSIKKVLLLSGILILIAGLHEMALIFTGALILYIVLFFKASLKIKWIALLLICLAILSFFLIHFTGASMTRMNNYEFAGYQNIISRSLLSFVKLFVLVFTSFPFLLALFAVFVFTDRKRDSFYNKSRFIFSLCFLLLLILFLIALPVVATSMVPPLRVYSFLCCLLIPALLFHAYIYRIHYFPQLKISFIQRFFLGRILAVIFIVSLLGGFYKVPGGEFLFTGNMSAAIHDLTFSARPYAEEMQARIDLIEHQAVVNRDTVWLNEIQHKPSTLVFLDITDENPKWIQHCFCRFYDFEGELILIE